MNGFDVINNRFLEEILFECHKYKKQGRVASYIPELAKANPESFGICIMRENGKLNFAGEFLDTFTIQSVIKPVILLLALIDKGEETVRKLVGVEATGKPFDAFNYSDQALRGDHINPMINTGAIALCTLIEGETYEQKFERLIELTRAMADNPCLDVDEQVYLSEKATGNKNRALAYMLKAYGMIKDDVESVVDCYFRACSIRVNCADLARIAFVLANKGVDPKSGKPLCPAEYTRFVNAVLMTCGMYDGSGEFALDVGFPAKSGVGGGIMGVVPGKLGIGIFSPSLDSKGNSLAGVKAMQLLSHKLDLSIF